MAVMAPWKTAPVASCGADERGLGNAFLTDSLPFEVASLVLLAALVGAVVIARKEIKETPTRPMTHGLPHFLIVGAACSRSASSPWSPAATRSASSWASS